MKVKRTLALMLAVALLGCGKQQPRHIVILLDVSQSIERESLRQAFRALDKIPGRLHRGDSLTIIPILGDAEAESAGLITRFYVPPNREAYDADLQRFTIQLSKSVEQLSFSAMSHPGGKTDILGSVTSASREIRTSAAVPTLLILSDFIQDDGEITFLNDKRLNSGTVASEFAKLEAKKQALDLGGIPVYLGRLRSREYAACNHGRRSAIRVFWLQYFKNLNSTPEFADDALGLLEQTI